MTHSDKRGMSLIVRTVCRGLAGFVLLYGVYVVAYGHLSPGGGFAGGVIAACAFVMILLAEGTASAQRVFSRAAASTLDSLGVLLFWFVAGLGLLVAGTYFANLGATPTDAHYALFSGGSIPVANLGIGLKVCSSLYLVVGVLSAFRLGSTPRDEGGDP